MKQVFEFIPIILFFITYKMYDIYTATAVVIGATILLVIFNWFKYGKVETMQWVTLGLITVMGGATLYLQDEQFIKWKLSIIEWAFGAAFLGSQFFGKQPFVQRMMGSALELPDAIWKRLNLMWAFFFTSVGFINLYVMKNYTTDDWVMFKTFGVPSLMVVFILLQIVLLYKYMPQTDSKSDE